MSSNPQDSALLRRVEEAALNSWPAPPQVLLGGWALRFIGGYTRRANSATPLEFGQDGPSALSTKIAMCETLYSAQSLPALIRIRSFDGAALAAALKARGYAAEGLSSVLWMPLGLHADTVRTAESVELSEGRPGPGWLNVQARLSGCDVAARDRILSSLAIPCAFAGVKVDGPESSLASVAFAAVHNGLVCLHLVAIDLAFRQRGLSRSVVLVLLAWGKSRAEARDANLQVAVENAGGLTLYAGLGFRTELFRYHYYRQLPA